MTDVVIASEDVEAGIQSLIDNQYGVERNDLETPGELDRSDLDEIVRLVLTYATKGVREAARRDGRRLAAQSIRAHADEHAPRDGNVQQRRLRRHLLIAARVAAGPPTDQEIRDAIRAGNYTVCHLDEAGQPIKRGGDAT